MNKQELLHLHSLVLEIATFCSTEEDVEIDLEAYYALGTNPLSIQQSKGRHEEAVETLVEAVVDGLGVGAEIPELAPVAD